MPRKSDAFWQFSLRIYAASDIEHACLALQGAGADVNLLLYCCWQGSRAKMLNKALLKQAIRLVANWQEGVVQPLRQARRCSKLTLPGVPAERGSRLRKQIAGLELNAERLEHLALAQLPVPPSKPKGEATIEQIAVENLTRYIGLLGVPALGPVGRHLQALSAATAKLIRFGN